MVRSKPASEYILITDPYILITDVPALRHGLLRVLTFRFEPGAVRLDRGSLEGRSSLLDPPAEKDVQRIRRMQELLGLRFGEPVPCPGTLLFSPGRR